LRQIEFEEDTPVDLRTPEEREEEDGRVDDLAHAEAQLDAGADVDEVTAEWRGSWLERLLESVGTP
jgi:hypothetical protein